MYYSSSAVFGATDPIRTDDLRITNALLYLLSHSSVFSFMIGFCSAVVLEKLSLITSKDLRITNALLYQLSHSSILIMLLYYI